MGLRSGASTPEAASITPGAECSNAPVLRARVLHRTPGASVPSASGVVTCLPQPAPTAPNSHPCPPPDYRRRGKILPWLSLPILLLAAPTLRAASIDAKAGAPVTFSKDIAPIVYANCSTCHHDGEAAPFSLLSYEDARKHAKQIVKVTSSTQMPPWKAEHGFGDFLGERRLTPDQIVLLQRWLDAGCPEGDPASAPKSPQYTAGWQLGAPDMVVKMPVAYTVPAQGRDVYRCFVIPVEIPAGKYLKAVEYRPGNRKVVHHAVICSMDEAKARRMEAAETDGQVGFRTGLNAPGNRLPGSLGIWAPGHDAVPLPEGYTVSWPQGNVICMQLHLNPSGKPEVEQSSLGLYFTDKAPIGRVQNAVLMNKNINIQPGDASYRVTSQLILPYSVDIIGLFPHMHLLGKECRATATLPDGTTRPLIWIKDWDFSWQTYYSFQKPLRLPAGTRVDASFSFDNSADNPRQPSNPPQMVHFGEQTVNEMGVLILDAIPADPVAAALADKFRAKAVKQGPPKPVDFHERAKQLISIYDTDHDGKLSLDELVASGLSTREQMEANLKRFDKDGDGKVDLDELTAALTALSAKPQQN